MPNTIMETVHAWCYDWYFKEVSGVDRDEKRGRDSGKEGLCNIRAKWKDIDYVGDMASVWLEAENRANSGDNNKKTGWVV